MDLWALHDQFAPSVGSANSVTATRVQMAESGSQLQTSPLSTPAHIVPGWYFLPFYSVLRAAPDKLGGVIAMFAFASVWIFMPWLDRGRPRPFWLRPRMRWLVPSVGAVVLVLGATGAMPAQGIAYRTSQIGTVLLFGLLLVGLPWASQDDAVAADQ